jgi:hypothetical protein
MTATNVFPRPTTTNTTTTPLPTTSSNITTTPLPTTSSNTTTTPLPTTSSNTTTLPTTSSNTTTTPLPTTSSNTTTTPLPTTTTNTTTTPTVPTIPTTSPAPRFQMGINLAPVAYYSSEWTFSNAMKMAGGWAQAGPTPRPQWVTTDTNLWPIQPAGSNEVAQTLMFRDINGHYPNGTYTATWDGQGDVWFGFDARIDWASATSNSVKFTVDYGTNAGICLRVSNSNPTNRVRNINIQTPGSGTGTFDQRYLTNIKPFYVLRFMDWQKINNSPVVNWSERPTAEQGIQTYDNGVAIEYMIELCNTLGSDPWLCVPHLASDDYIRQMATLVKSKLNKDRVVYLEYSNEVWNDAFVQGQWALQQANAQGISRAYFYADKARNVFRIWQDVWGADKGRIIRVAAGHEAVPWTATQIATRLNGEFDAISCAAYFYPLDADAATLNSSTTGSDICKMLLKQINTEGIGLLKQHKALANQWATTTGRPIQFLAYEGGQHLYTNTDLPWGQAGVNAQYDPLMATCYQTMLDACKAMDMRVFMAYNSVMNTTKWGAWGAMEWQDQPISATQKMSTLLKYTTRR